MSLRLAKESLDDVLDEVKRLRSRHGLHQLSSLLVVLGTAFTMWQFAIIVLDNPSPVVVVLSGSMLPGIARGDLLVVSGHHGVGKNGEQTLALSSGDVVVYRVGSDEIPIVHRIVELHKKENASDGIVLTKGDANEADDRLLYFRALSEDQSRWKDSLWLRTEDIFGKVVAHLPYIGHLSLLLKERAIVKFGVVGGMVSFLLLYGEN